MLNPNKFAVHLISGLSYLFFTVVLCLVIPHEIEASVRDDDSELNSLKLEVETLKSRIDVLEEQLTSVLQLVSNTPLPGKETLQQIPVPVITGTPSGSVEYSAVTTTDNSAINVGGRVKLDAIYNSHSVGGNSGTNGADLSFFPSLIPVSGTGEDDQFSFNARQTRLWLKGYSPSEYGEMAGYIEIDFDSSSTASDERVSNSFIPRLRHAYGTIAGITLGQTYTTFMNVSAYPEVNDLNGPVGIMNIRQPLLRYRIDRDWGNLYLALENPETTLTTISGVRLSPDDDRLPDLVAKIEFSGDWGNWSISGMAREIRNDSNIASITDDSTWGGAMSTSGRIRLGDQDNLRFNLSYGNSLGRYLSFNGFNDGVIADNGRIILTEIFGGYLAYQHWWTEDLRSTISAGFAHANNSVIINPSLINETFYSTHLNLIWSPSLNAAIGIEWLHGYRELEDGQNGTLDRIQLTSIYKF